MDFIFEQILFGGILPALIMGAALLVGAFVASQSDDQITPWGCSVSLGYGLAFGAVFLGTVGLPEILPTNAMHWLFYMAVVAATIGVAEAFTQSKEWLQSALRLGLALLTFRLTLGFMVEHHWEGAMAWVWLGALTLGSNALITALERAARARPGATLPLVMSLLSAGGAAVLVLTGNARIAQLMGGVFAASATALLVAWRRPDLRVSRGGSTVFGLLFSALLAYGYFTSADIPAFGEALSHSQTLATLLVAAAPLMLWVGGQNPIKRMSAGRSLLAIAALVALPLGAAIWVAAHPGDPPVAEYEHEGYDYDYDYAYE